ncbi:MAG: bifunctional folylpolyglutamate synthase/dihydrofolate synthase [Oscillospiraceae bacterium]|jgi:dihydrofolate synthase/folylpolyglutamate synthase|nr:bifunctional folylpolyglutamate synthase/dihydrofolate synthase [Oscillospiraceae bacterium]
MEYAQALAKIHALERFGIKPGLERVRAFCAALGDPQRRLRCIHVAGTNGKGSTSAMLAGILQAAGYKTGLYTSPYVLDFRERMQIDGQMIPKGDLARWAARGFALAANLPEAITEFEFVTGLAFAWFAEQKCDCVVLETGLGGRWDATNIIEASLCSVITKISLDHTQVLGNTVEEIAAEKCGILKPGCAVIACCEQPPQAYNVIQETAARLGCPLVIPNERECAILAADPGGSSALLAGLRVRVPFAGAHMCRNALTCVTSARLLGSLGALELPEAAIAAGIAAARLPARMELLCAEPPVLLDGGHNPDAGQALAALLRQFWPGRHILVLCGMMADKDIGAYLKHIVPLASVFVACRPAGVRAMETDKLLAAAAQAGAGEARAIDEPVAAARAVLALQAEDPGAVLVVCGSFFLAGELRAIFMAKCTERV